MLLIINYNNIMIPLKCKYRILGAKTKVKYVPLVSWLLPVIQPEGKYFFVL